MQKLKRSKGFTLTELAIVIAVIAILIAVLVPTFVSLINKANESADEQTTKNINTALSVYEADNGKPSHIDEVKEALSAAGFGSSLEPASSGYYYYWSSEYNIVMLIEISSQTWELVYPATADAEDALANGKAYCYNINANGTNIYQDAIVSLAQSGEEITIGQTTSTADAQAKNAAKKAVAAAASVSNSMKDYTYAYSDFVAAANLTKESFKGVTVKLTSDITLSSTDPVYNFQGTFDGNSKTITVAAGGITPVYDTVSDSNNGYSYSNGKYSYGLFASVTNGGTVKNLNIKYSDTVEDETANTKLSAIDPGYQKTYFGGITGFLGGNSTISGCKVTGSIVQYNRIGGIVGTSYTGNITNCTVEADITSLVYSNQTGYSNAGGIVAYVGEDSTYNFTLNISNCTVGPETGTMTITAGQHVGGIAANITSGTDEVDLSGCTVHNVTVTSNYTSSNYEVYGGAVIGAISNGTLTGTVTVASVSVKTYTAGGASTLVYLITRTSGEESTTTLGKHTSSSENTDNFSIADNMLCIIGNCTITSYENFKIKYNNTEYGITAETGDVYNQSSQSE